uniref:Kruppel-like zinc finger protein n=1 Tax=Apis cerana TaxID=7461 RepID=V9IMU4_APICE
MTLNCKSFPEMENHESIVSEDFINLNNLQEINQVTDNTISIITDSLIKQNGDYLLQENKKLNNYQAVISNLIKNRMITSSNYSFEKDKKFFNQAEQHLYIHNEPLTSIIVQNKCINIFPQIQSKIQLNKSKKFTFLNKHMQGIKENENQNTILLLANNTLQNNIFKIDQNNTADNEIKKQIFDESK